MRVVLSYILVIYINSFPAIGQNYELSPEQIKANKRFEKLKIEYINKQYQDVINFYDSAYENSRGIRFETYKMASESSLKLAETNAIDSTFLKNRSRVIYEEAIKWHGKMFVEEKWDSMKIEISKESEIFAIVEQQPEPQGGFATFYKYVGQNLKYPDEARRKGIQGKVYVQFIVNKDGSIDAVNVVQGIGGGCDKEAVRVIRNAPDFIPGRQDGKPVYVRMILPLTFKLAGKPKKKKKRKRG